MNAATLPSGGLAPGSVIGIAGGGQLGRMLAMAAARLGFHTIIYDPAQPCPAAQAANSQIVATFDDEAARTEFATECDVITYEFENIPLAFVEQISQETPVYPPPAALAVSQDRLAEKEFFGKLGITTAPFFEVNDPDQLRQACERLGGPGILKTRRMGYDGKGQVRLKPGDEAAMQTADELASETPCTLEGFVEFDQEISVIAARGIDGRFGAFDPARNRHEEGILRQSQVPCGASEELCKAAADIARQVTESLGYVGVIGIEFFVTPGGGLIANEFAPRVHNSGHWTEAACAVSQFEQHIRAICGLPLSATGRHSDCVMTNLIGFDVEALPLLLAEPGTLVHLYGKSDIRDGRKMGHVTRLLPKS